MSQKADRSRRTVRFAREGWYFLFILAFIVIGSILRQMNLLFLLIGLMVTPLFLNWRFAISTMYYLLPMRRTTDVVNAGQTTFVEWSLTNARSWLTAWNVKIVDRIRQVDPGDAAQKSEIELIVPQVAPNGTTHSSYRIHFSQRGKYILGPARISTTFPLGLIRGAFWWQRETELYVGPRLGELTPIWHQRMASLAAGNSSNQRRRGIEQEEFYALRPWKSGDSIRWIHWRSSAKANDLIVKQFDQKGDRDFAILLDCYIDDDTNPWTPSPDDSIMAEGPLGPPQFATSEQVELAISCTATILFELENWIRGQVAVSFCGQSVWTATTQAYSQFLAELMRRLAVIRPTMNTRFEQGLLELANHASAGTPLIVISTRPRPEFTGDMSPMYESALKRADWIQVGTPYCDELFQFDLEKQRQELISIFHHKADEALESATSEQAGEE